MPIIGNPKTFDKRFSFRVQIDGFLSASFTKCSELTAETGVIKHREGGGITETKSAGLLTFPPITLERGAGVDPSMWLWHEMVSNGAAGVGLVEQVYKRHLDIIQLDRNGSPLKRWSLFNAFPTKFVAGAWDNSAEENVIETLTLEYEYFTRTL